MATTFAAVVRELADAFTTDTRDDGSRFSKLRDDCADWIDSDTMHEIHSAIDDRAPDDWVYDRASLAAGTLADYAENGDDTADELRDRCGGIADGLVDVYNARLGQWLGSHLNNQSLVDEAREEFGHRGSISDDIQMGQYLAIDRICHAIVAVCEAEAEDREEADA